MCRVNPDVSDEPDPLPHGKRTVVSCRHAMDGGPMRMEPEQDRAWDEPKPGPASVVRRRMGIEPRENPVDAASRAIPRPTQEA
jgi:hypothetical protein